MDPDSGGYCTSSAFFKTSVLTITFSTFYFYNTDNNTAIFKPPPAARPVIAAAIVKEKPKPKKKKTIYLTFDDGPNKGTKNVLNIISEEQIPATLFVIGEHVYGSRSQSAAFDSAALNSLIEIANHSFTHAFENHYEKFYSVPDSVVNDFKRCADSLGLVSNIVRTPGRNIWRIENICRTDIKSSTAAADSLENRGFKIMGWDLEWHFDQHQHIVQSKDELIRQVDSMFANKQTKTEGHMVLLAHDQVYAASSDSTALQQFISDLKARDEFDFETASKYPGIQN